MADSGMADSGVSGSVNGPLRLGDPVPWFSAPTLSGGRVDIHVDAGRWILLAFIGDLSHTQNRENLQALLGRLSDFSEDHLVCHVVLAATPDARDTAALAALSGPALNFLLDDDGAIARLYGAAEAPRSFILDSMLRSVADLQHDQLGFQALLGDVIKSLPPIDKSVGVEMNAPVLIVPRVFDFELCDLLVSLFDESEGEDSGFLLDRNGLTQTVINPALKCRRDIVISDPQLADIMRDRVVTRVLPAMERFFNYEATRMDRTLVSRYDSESGGHFFRHRDNENAGAAHRQFAMTIGLNKDFTGGELRFPEFGRRTYAAPVGGAVIFSCGMLHEVLPVLSGKRFVFVPFLYGEAEAAMRARNNRLLAASEAPYTGAHDRLVA